MKVNSQNPIHKMYAYGYEDYYDEQSSNAPSATENYEDYSVSTKGHSVASRRMHGQRRYSEQSQSMYDQQTYDESQYSEEQAYYDQSRPTYDQPIYDNSHQFDEQTSYDSEYEQTSSYDGNQYSQSTYDRGPYYQADSVNEQNQHGQPTYYQSSDTHDEEGEYYDGGVEESYDEYADYDEYFEEEEEVDVALLMSTVQFEDGNTATREVNISKLMFSAKAEEELPDSYKNAEQYGEHFLKLPKRDQDVEDIEPHKTTKSIVPIRMLPVDNKPYQYSYPFTKRRYYTATTIVAAVGLAATGVYLSTQSLATLSPQQYRASYVDKNADYLYLPRFQFGGFTGGLKGDIQRRVDIAEASMDTSIYQGALPGVVPILRTSDATKVATTSQSHDPFHGFGPPQFNPAANTRSVHKSPSDKVTLTSTELTRYNPPTDQGPAVVLDPMFHGSMMDVSFLPYNPTREVPVFWDVPLTGGQRVQTVFGKCLKLVQCSDVGKELLTRQLEENGASNTSPSSDREPPLKADFIYSSIYTNVDCSTSTGIDRGISLNLATSNMVDIIYSPHIMDAARLFLPPVEAYGRGIVLMRDPVERVLALYEYLTVGKHDDSNGVNKMSLEQFARSGKSKHNCIHLSL